jgi:hypothetical protein
VHGSSAKLENLTAVCMGLKWSVKVTGLAHKLAQV